MDELSVVQLLGGQSFIEDLALALTSISHEVVRTGNEGKVTATFSITQVQEGSPLVSVDEVITRKHPREEPGGALFFALDGELHQEDPRQLTLSFFDVGAASSADTATPIRSVGD